MGGGEGREGGGGFVRAASRFENRLRIVSVGYVAITRTTFDKNQMAHHVIVQSSYR